MKNFRADLHIHSVLSPCGDLEMSPINIVKKAKEKELDLIAITDHNHTGHAKITRKIGEEYGLWVIYGVEVTSYEEVHCLAFFDKESQIDSFQEYIDRYLPRIANDTDLFGHQLIVDEDEIILQELVHSLYPGIKRSINEISECVRGFGGLFVPAHVDRKMNGLYSQLGILPEELQIDAIEIFRKTSRKEILQRKKELSKYQLLKSSDAHFINDIGRCTSTLQMKELNFREFSLAIQGIEGRGVIQE